MKRAFRIVYFELYPVLEVDGVAHHGVRTVGAYFRHDAFVYGTGEDEPAVVVGVLADEVDTSRREVDVAGLAVEVFDETASYEFNVHVSNVFS